MATCSCDYSLQNTGLPNCNYVLKYAVAAMLTPMRDSAGTANKIAAGATVNDAYIIAKFNDTDATQRFYYLKNLKNANVGTPAEPVYQTFDDNSKVKISNGITSASFIFAASSPTFLGKMQSFECEQMGIYFIDKEGYIIGIANSAGDLLPIEIAANSMNSQPTYGTPTTTYQITTTFDWEASVEHAEVAAWENTVNWSSATICSLIDVNVVVSNESTTGYTLTLTMDYGSVNSKLPVEGLVITDFVSSVGGATSKIRRTNNTPADVSITSVTESAAGVYDFVIPTATAADILQPAASKNGFDFSNLLDVTVVIP